MRRSLWKRFAARPRNLLGLGLALSLALVATFADLQYALHRGPKEGKLPITWEHDGKTVRAELELAPGWRTTYPGTYLLQAEWPSHICPRNSRFGSSSGP